MVSSTDKNPAYKKFTTTLSKLPIKVKAAIVVAVALVVFLGVAFIVPAIKPDPKTEVMTESNLEKAVAIGELSTLDYVYRGVAEKPGMFDSVEYRVRYEAHVDASFDMDSIEFKIDDANGLVTAVLPEPTIGEPVIDGTKLDYLPDGATGRPDEMIALCKEDAKAEVEANDQIREWSFSNLESAVKSLTMPLMKDGYELDYEYPGEFDGGTHEEA